MRARFEHDGDTYEGTVSEDETTVTADGETFSLDEVELLPPCEPTKIICVGRNYAEHADELGNDVPDFPLLFFKPPSAVVGAYDSVRYPDTTDELHYEGELGVVIRESAKDVSVDEAEEYVDGYTCVNDVTARDWQERESQWARAKGGDTFCPLGPYVAEPSLPLEIETRVNGETVQSSTTERMHFSVEELVSEASRFMTLNPGDVIATGTPSGVGELRVGDTVGVEIEGVGELTNEVAEG